MNIAKLRRLGLPLPEEYRKNQIKTVQRVDQSPLNSKRWCLLLSCGHEVWVTSNKKPSRMKAPCETCPKV